MHQPATDTLRLFVAKVEYLDSLSLVKSLVEPGSKLTLSFGESGLMGLEFTGPSREQIDAFVLTMRLFLQDNDRISIRNVARAVEGLPVREDLKAQLSECRDILNEHLDTDCSYAPGYQRVTNRCMLETVLYGELCHINADARERYVSWTSDPLSAQFVEMEFVGQIAAFLSVLRLMSTICGIVLDESGTDASGS